MQRSFLISQCSLTVVFALVLASVPAVAESTPNVVLIMADDLGYHDLSGYGHPKIKTPVLDQLAKDGLKLTSFYAGATVCTPSRMALMTGAYPIRLGWKKGVVGYLMNKNVGMSPEALTMAEVFQTKGYRTGLFGKWHLGDRKPFLPHRQGFDVAYYINKSNNQTPKLWRGDELLENPFSNRLLTEKFTREAIRFIEESGEKPFFLYVPYSAPHFPLEAHPKWKGKSAFGVYGDVVEEMDARIGEILATLERRKIAKRTIVVFLSDNGPEPLTKESKALPFRGKKWSSLEGGTRVPCILRYPGVIHPGSESDSIVSAMDLLPTLSKACGIDLAKISKGSPVIDGVDVWNSLTSEAGGRHPRNTLLYWHGRDGPEAIRVGDWKLFFKGKSARLGRKVDANAPALFQLAKDIDETDDVSAKHPEKVAELKKLAEQELAHIRSRTMSLGNAKPAAK